MKLFFSVLALGLVSVLSAQTSISVARQAPLNSTVSFRGVVINGSELGPIRYIQDSTAGIALYGNNLSSINRGDSIFATGVLTDYNNLLEVTPVTNFTVYTANVQPQPVVITPAQMGEAYESQLVRINNVTFNAASSTFAGNTSYTFVSNSQTGTVYIRTGSPLVGMIIPSGYVTLTGVASQFLTTYQLLPRDAADFISNSSITITTAVTQTNISSTGFDLDWGTNISGTTFIKYGFTPSLELGVINGAPGITHSASVTGANPSAIFFAQAFSVSGTDTAFSPVRSYATVSASTGVITAYFNKSVDTTLATTTNATLLFYTFDDTLIAYIDRAQESIDLAIYSFDNQNISNISTALNNAFARGVKIRVISDGGNPNPGISTLNPAINRILSPVTPAYTIMHNKFIIIDAQSADPALPVVWTGATNWTDNQMQTDANDVIIFQDQSMAKGFTIEFEEMWGDTGLLPNLQTSRFGQFKIDNTPHEYIIDGKRVEQYFSPSDGTNAKIIEKINTATTDLCVATMQFTRTDLANALTNASLSGVTVYVLVNDSSSSTTWSILDSGLPQGHLAQYQSSGIMHHKYAIIDPTDFNSDPMVVTGSHNWTTSADTKNDENTVIIHDSTIANIYYQEFSPRFTQNGGIISITENNPAKATITAYPNPSNDVCFINYTLEQAENTFFTLTDVTGKILMTWNVASAAGENKLAIQTNTFVPGVYLLHVSGKQYAASVKIVIQ